jgi:hypothetical protein
VVCIDPSLLVAVKICGVSKLQTSTAYRDSFYLLSLAPSLHLSLSLASTGIRFCGLIDFIQHRGSVGQLEPSIYLSYVSLGVRSIHANARRCWAESSTLFDSPSASFISSTILSILLQLFDNPDNPSSTRASARESIATMFDRRGKRKLAATSSDDEDFAVADVMQ